MRYINKVFDIRPDEWRRLLFLYALAFLLNVTVVWGQAASEALFLKQLGVEYLPLMFIADALLTIVAITIYGAFVDRFSNKSLMIGISLLGGVLLGLVRFGLQIEFTAVYYLLYLLDRVLKALISIHSWTYIADFYDTRDAKRHFPVIASASRPSGILAGVLLVPLVQYSGTEDLLFAWIIVLLLSGWLAWYTPRQVTLVAEVKEESKISALEGYREGFSYVASSPFLRLLAVTAIVGTILLYLLDYYSQHIFVERFESTEELASFYGLLGAFSDLLILPIQMVLLSRFVTRFGVGKANLIFPSLTTLSYALMSFLPNLVTASFARMDRTALRSAFRTPIDSLLYNALPLEIKGRSRAFINGMLIPVGTLLAGCILLTVNEENLEQSLWAITLFGLILSAIYMVVSLRTETEYTNSLFILLSNDESTLFRLSHQALLSFDPTTRQLLNQRLEACTDDDLTIFMAEMLIEIEGSTALERLEQLAIHGSPKVQAALLNKMASFWASAQKDRVLYFSLVALSSQHSEVRHAALKLLASAPHVAQDKNLQDIFRAHLNDPDKEVQAAALVPLLASAENQHLFSSLVPDFSHSDAQIRRQTVKLIHQIATQTDLKEVRRSILDRLRAALSDEDESVRLAAVKALADLSESDANQALLLALSDASFLVRSEACAAMTPLPELEEMLLADNRYLAESAAYILASNRQIKRQIKSRILELIEKLLRDAYILQGQRLLIESLVLPAAKLLDQTLHEKVELLIQRAFWLLGALSDQQKALSIQQALRSQNSLTRANGAETLESLASPRLSHLIVPLFDAHPLALVVEIGHKMLGLPYQNMQHFLCQAWPQLCGTHPETLKEPNGTSRLSLPHLDETSPPLSETGWLTAIVIYMLWEIRQQGIEHGSFMSLLNHKVFVYALKATLHDRVPALVRETATFVWYTLGESISLENPLPENNMLTTIEKILFLKQVSFFQKMELKHLRILADISEEVSYRKGEKIVEQGEEGDALYVVVSGRVAMQRETNRRGTPAIIRLTSLHPHDYFAEMSIFDNKAHDADAVALKDTTLLLVRQRPLMALIEHHPELSVSLLKVLSERLRRANDLIASKSPSKPKLLVELYDNGSIHQLGAFENRILLP